VDGPAVSKRLMRRFGIVLTVALVVCATAIYLGSRRPTPGSSAQAVVRFSLLAQQSPVFEGTTRHWKTTRRVSLACDSRPPEKGAVSGSDQALCDAVAYYSRHVPARRCFVRGLIPLRYDRVVIAGSLNGRPVHLTMGAICNPRPALSRAVQAIYVAAFR
jgi:hypothetical protein